ncbi:hypothetical protein Plim_0169 [Planctopirus limnophila DSM 3776]|uniref:Uncharacterized protein n=1 Tax=Planctopirus limnophila (strain ATCC 43296 / DSM 3776 / IFAM 1008 / Mu 290) TaxID=521674 RepID=D5SN94_PLAL2|nr:hypothetical protein [Planctopirus limnophila]ADG66021.1 hypothetical protein Plim_0169 [Planctopirus limnophila DSM 3776]
MVVNLSRGVLVGLQVGLLLFAALVGGGLVGGLLQSQGSQNWREVLIAGLICLVPSLVSVVWNEWLVVGRHSQNVKAAPSGAASSVQAMSALGGMGLRMGAVAIGIVLLPKIFSDWQTKPFFYSVLVVYVLLLVIETSFLLYGLKHFASLPRASSENL